MVLYNKYINKVFLLGSEHRIVSGDWNYFISKASLRQLFTKLSAS